jgi:hypothetical protein
MGGTIAIDGAGVEQWTIEFVTDREFYVVGSKTGADGQGSLNDVFISKSASLLIPRENWKGTPKRGDRFTFKTTSPSYRFWLDGRNPLPDVKLMAGFMRNGTKVHPGNWRIEVAPGQPANFNSFLHFLYPCDRATAEMPVVQPLRSQNALLQGLTVAEWAIMFRVRKPLNQITSYRVSGQGTREHLVLGLDPEREFRVTVRPGDGKKDQIYALKASKEGVLRFGANGPAEIEIAPLSSL